MTPLNHVALSLVHAAGSLTDTYDPSSAGTGFTVKAGASFTPTAGNLLVAFCGGQVTWTAPPTGWTLPPNGNYVNNYGTYVFWKTAAGSDTLTATHNGDGSWPTGVEFFEFPAGAVFQAAGNSGAALKANGSTVVTSGLTGTYWFGSMALTELSTGTTSWVESAGTEQADFYQALSGKGFTWSTTTLLDQVATSQTVGHTCTGATTTQQRMQAVVTNTTAAAAANPRPLLVARQAVNRTASF